MALITRPWTCGSCQREGEGPIGAHNYCTSDTFTTVIMYLYSPGVRPSFLASHTIAQNALERVCAVFKSTIV